VTGDKARLRPDSFADHYSQPRQFYISQTASEQGHIKAALVFELSKCTEPAIRARIVAHLRNIDEDMAADVAARLGLAELPAPAARPTNTDLRPSKALSIQLNAPDSFHGRVMGVMLSDGFDGTLLAALEKSVAKEGGLVKILAPRIGGVLCSKDNLHKVDEKIGSAPSVLFDAVAILPGQDSLATTPPALAFLSEAYQHCKYIGWSEPASALIAVCGLSGAKDTAFCALTDVASVTSFVKGCKALRHWPREVLFMV
jgi:catalase